MRLREEYSTLSDYLMGENEDPHTVDQLTLDDGSKFDYRVDNEGYIHYKAEPGYTYYEETHKRTITDDVQASLLRSYIVSRATGGFAGTFNLSKKSMERVGFGGNIGNEYLSNYMNSNKLKNSKFLFPLYKPDIDQVKTTIYRENKEGDIENMVIDSADDQILDYRSWREYN